MPYKDKDKQKEFQRIWVAQRRAAWLNENGPCIKCGAQEDLEVDHVNPAEKVTHLVWTWTEKRRLAELAKCQVLCRACHQEKTSTTAFLNLKHGEHAYAKYGCRCVICGEAHSQKMRAYHAKKRGTRRRNNFPGRLVKEPIAKEQFGIFAKRKEESPPPQQKETVGHIAEKDMRQVKHTNNTTQ